MSPPLGRRGTVDAADRERAAFFMRLALDEARRGEGRTSPNPPVGALIVSGGKVIARGHHARAGGPHAEAVALARAGERARGADLYTTLEPCDHTGKTPPCARAILESGVSRVFIGSADPNPLVSGRGVRRLRRAGTAVAVDVLREDCDRFIAPWLRFMESGRPHVTLKVAMTIDGRIATASGDSRWITGELARAEVHGLRDKSDAILVGVGTLRADDPLLTARPPGGKGRDPLRIVLDSNLRTPPRARVFASTRSKTVLACVAPIPLARAKRLEAAGAELLVCRAARGRVSLPHLLEQLAARGVVRLLVEGGAETYAAFLAAGLVDRLLLHLGAKVVGAGPSWLNRPFAREMAKAPGFTLCEARLVGGDLLIEATPRPQARAVRPRRRAKG